MTNRRPSGPQFRAPRSDRLSTRRTKSMNGMRPSRNSRSTSYHQVGKTSHVTCRKKIESLRMNCLQEEVIKSHINMQPMLRRNRNNNVNSRHHNYANIARVPSGKAFHSSGMVTEQMMKRNGNVKIQQDKFVSPVAKCLGELDPKVNNIGIPRTSTMDKLSILASENACQSNPVMAKQCLDPAPTYVEQINTLSYTECPILLREKISLFSSLKNEQLLPSRVIKERLFSSSKNVEEQSIPLRREYGSGAAAGRQKRSYHLMALEGLALKSYNVAQSNEQPYCLNAMERSDLNAWRGDVLNPCKEEGLGSRSNNMEQSNPLNQREGSIAWKESNESSSCLDYNEPITPTLKSSEGSNLSGAKECSVPREGNAKEYNKRQDELLMNVKDIEMKDQISAVSSWSSSSGEARRRHDDHDRRDNTLKAKEGPSPKSTLACNLVGRSDLQSNKVKSSFSVVDNIPRDQRAEVLWMVDDNHANLPSKNVRRGKLTKRNFKARNEGQPTAYTRGRKKKDAKLEKDRRTVNGAHFDKDGRKTAPLRDKRVPDMRKTRGEEDIGEEAVQPENSNPRCFENDRPMKKRRRYIETNLDGEADIGDQKPNNAPNDIAGFALQTENLKDQCTQASAPFFSDSVKPQYRCTQPIDAPVWRGIFKIGSKGFISLAAHLSIKACEKVCELSRSLPPALQVAKLSRSEAWPKSWEASRPTDQSIGLLFFPHNMCPNEELDRLMKEVMDGDMALKIVVGITELLVFPSTLLPEQYHRFQRKYYLWGVFKRREATCDRCVAEEKVREHHASDQEIYVVKHAVYLENQQSVCLDQQHVSEQENSVSKHVMHLENQQPEDSHHGAEKEASKTGTGEGVDLEQQPHEQVNQQEAAHEFTSLAGSNASLLTDHPPSNSEAATVTSHATKPADHGPCHSGTGAPLRKLLGFVLAQTTRVQQLIQQMECEGALLFEVGEMVGDSNRVGLGTK